LNNAVDIPDMFLNLILEQKENKARGKKFELQTHAGTFHGLGSHRWRGLLFAQPSP
jgi:hypothetical protein